MRYIQPQIGPARVNWSNPFSQKLTVLIHGGIRYDAVAAALTGSTGAMLTTVTQSGRGVAAAADSAANCIYGSASTAASGPLTDFLLIENFVTRGGTVYLYGCGTYAGGSTGVGITVQHASLTNNWGIADLGSTLSGGLANSGEVLPTGTQFLVYTRDGASHRLYRNGKLIATVSGTSGDVSAGKFAHGSLQWNGGTFSVASPMLLSGRINRCLTANDVAGLSANPWQLFASPRRILKAGALTVPTLSLATMFNPTSTGGYPRVTRA